MRALWCVSLAALVACATTTNGDPDAAPKGDDDARFPSKERLEEVASNSVDAEIKKGVFDPVRFELVGELPDVTAQVASTATGALAKLAVATLPNVVRTAGLDCAARQFAKLKVDEGKLPGQNFQRFVLGRCGALATSAGLNTLTGTADPKQSADELVSAWSEQLQELIKQIGAAKRPIGLAMHRDGENVAFVGVIGAERFVLEEPVQHTPEKGAVLIKGRLVRPAEEVRAVVTRGRFEAKYCTQAPIALPQFQLVCPVEASDTFATIQLSARRRGRLLGDSLGQFLARPGGSEGRVFEIPKRGAPVAATDAEGVASAFAAGLNKVRAEAGMKALRIDEDQTATVKKLARPFLAAIAGGREEILDAITLGTMAGWDVDGVLESGGFAWSFLAPTEDVNALLAFALESPSARLSLLDPQADRVAVGGLHEAGAMAAIVGVYRTFEDTPFEEAADRVWAQLEVAAAARGHQAPTRFEAAHADALFVARALEKGELDNKSALSELTNRTKSKSTSGVRALAFSVDKVDAIDFPAELLVPGLELTVSIGHMAPREGEAWGRYVVFAVINVKGAVTAHLVESVEIPSQVAGASLRSSMRASSSAAALSPSLTSRNARSSSRARANSPAR